MEMERIKMTDKTENIHKMAQEMRLIQAEMSRAFPCYLGSSLSVTDILAVLYFSIMKVDPKRPKDPDRDVLALSKGHASPALYAALCLRGFVKRILTRGKEAIRAEVMRFFPKMMAEGGFTPNVDHAVPENVSFENYRYYTELTRQIADNPGKYL